VRKDTENKKSAGGEKQYVNETQKMVINGRAVKYPF